MKNKGIFFSILLFFLLSLTFVSSIEESMVSPEEIGSLISALLFLILFMGIFILAYYIYTSYALMKIADKTKTKDSWLAWIPYVNLILIARIARMHWWPVLPPFVLGILCLIILFPLVFTGSSAVFVIFIIFFILFVVSGLILTIYSFIWYWKMFEAVKRPGWWILLVLIPYVGGLIFLILLGIAAFSGEEIVENRRDKK